jgi:hypothetical protein
MDTIKPLIGWRVEIYAPHPNPHKCWLFHGLICAAFFRSTPAVQTSNGAWFVWRAARREDGQRNMGANGARHPLIKDDGVVEFFIIQRERRGGQQLCCQKSRNFSAWLEVNQTEIHCWNQQGKIISHESHLFIAYSGILFETEYFLSSYCFYFQA